MRLTLSCLRRGHAERSAWRVGLHQLLPGHDEQRKSNNARVVVLNEQSESILGKQREDKGARRRDERQCMEPEKPKIQKMVSALSDFDVLKYIACTTKKAL